MQARGLFQDWLRAESGATALEFGLILPVFLMLLIGTVSASTMAGAVSGMHFAVEEAARCSAVNKTLCATTAATVKYAQSRYAGPDVAPVFQATGDGCGHTVTATANFKLMIAIATINVPLRADACYPGVDESKTPAPPT